MHNQFTYQIIETNTLAANVSQIILSPMHKPLSYEAGQYAHVYHQDLSFSPLSIACAPKDNNLLEFHLFHSPQNFKAQEILQIAHQKKTWQLSGPYGVCTASRLLKVNKPIIFVARGTGFAPIKAVIEVLTAFPHCPPMHLYWSAATTEDFYLTELISTSVKQGNFSYTQVLTSQRSDQIHFLPHPLQEKILQDHKDLSRHQVYVGGSRPLVHAIFQALHEAGMYKELFYSDVAPEDSVCQDSRKYKSA